MKQIRIELAPSFQRQIKKLEQKGLYSMNAFSSDIQAYIHHQEHPKRRKHKIILQDATKKIRSVSLGYDLRTLYYSETITHDTTVFVFFRIGNHNQVY